MNTHLQPQLMQPQLIQPQLMQPKGEHMNEQTLSNIPKHRSAIQLQARWPIFSIVLVAVAACGGGSGSTGSGATSTASSSLGSTATPAATSNSTAPAGTTTTSTASAALGLADAKANAQALTSISSTPVNAAVWSQLNDAGADTVRSLVASNDTVVVSTFKTIADPTGGPGLIKVFDAVVARGSLNANRVFQLNKGALPIGETLVWVNVNGEDFTRNNPSAESALEITVTALGSALVAPLP